MVQTLYSRVPRDPRDPIFSSALANHATELLGYMHQLLRYENGLYDYFPGGLPFYLVQMMNPNGGC